MPITGTIVTKAGDRKRRVSAARARIAKRNSPEARERDRLLHELIHQNDYLIPLSEATARRDRAAAEVDRQAMRVRQYEDMALASQTGRVPEALAHASYTLDAARRMLATAQAAVDAERERLGDKAPADEKGAAR